MTKLDGTVLMRAMIGLADDDMFFLGGQMVQPLDFDIDRDILIFISMAYRCYFHIN